MRGLSRILASSAFAIGLASAASAADLVVLAEDVPAGLNVDGATIAIPTTQTGVDNLMEPLVYYQSAGTNDEGIKIFDFDKFEGRLAESGHLHRRQVGGHRAGRSGRPRIDAGVLRRPELGVKAHGENRNAKLQTRA